MLKRHKTHLTSTFITFHNNRAQIKHLSKYLAVISYYTSRRQRLRFIFRTIKKRKPHDTIGLYSFCLTFSSVRAPYGRCCLYFHRETNDLFTLSENIRFAITFLTANRSLIRALYRNIVSY